MDNNRYRFEEEQEKVKEEKEKVKLEKEKVKEEKEKVKLEKEEVKEEKEKVKLEKEKTKEEIKLELEEVIKYLKNDVLKAKADGLNLKKRLEDDHAITVKYANQKLLEKFVNQLDLFDKVVSTETDDPNLKNYLVGFRMINTNFKQILKEEGVEVIPFKKGKPHDPKYQQVLQTGWDKKYKEGVVLEQLQTGYTYKDRILRPALIKVNKKEGDKENE